MKRLWKGTRLLFLTLWAVMMGLLGALSVNNQEARVSNKMEASRRQVGEDYREIWSGTADEDKKSMILSGRLGSELYSYNGIALFRLYASDGQELARSQMARGFACLPGTGIYSWYFLLDPVLSQEEQLALAKLFREDTGLHSFFGSSGGLVAESETDERYCEVIGVADWDREVIYPKTITYVYTDRELTLVDSDSDFFEGKELTTLRFDGVQTYSSLVGKSASPQEMLRRWREAEEKLDSIVKHYPPGFGSFAFSTDGSECSSLDSEVILASAYSYSPLRLAAEELWPTALFTLLAAVAMAFYTDKKQRVAIQRERNFTRAAAHELKTPLAILRTHAEALREDIAPEKREQYLDIVLDESDRMAELVSRLLEFSRLETGVELMREEVDLSALVREVWEPLSLQLEKKEITLSLELEEVRMQGDRERLREIVENLASNALRHGTRGGRIRVKIEKCQREVHLSTYNDGPAIPAEDLPHLFEPFYRGDKSRNREYGGTGLGLAIVRAAAAVHGGSCQAENLEKGTCFLVRLPLANTDGR